MANLKHAGSFTNRPKLRGQIDPDTGEEWIYTPDQPYWRDYEKDPVTHPESTMGNGKAMVETPSFAYAGSMEELSNARAMVKRQDKMLADAKERKAREAKKPGIPDRETFVKEFVLPRLGGVDPYMVDPRAKGEEEFAKNKSRIMREMFPDVPSGGMLTEDQQKFANKEFEKALQYYVNREVEKVKLNKNLYNHMLLEYDKAGKEREAKEEKRRTLLKELLKETPAQKRAATEKAKTAGEIRRSNLEYEKQIALRKEQRKYEGGKEQKQPSPVTWTTATKELKGRFGKQDPVGNIIITPELAAMHRIAQKRLVALKKQGIEPLQAINIAEDFARKAEEKYWQYIDSIKGRPDIAKLKQAIDGKFKKIYNYVPRMRPR